MVDSGKFMSYRSRSVAAKILVVEDDPLVRRATVRVLARRFEVVEADDYAGAVCEFERHDHLRAVVSDYDLGGGPDGAAVLDEARRRFPDALRVIVSGALPQRVAARMAEARIAHGFVEKPWDPDALLAVVEDGLRRLAR